MPLDRPLGIRPLYVSPRPSRKENVKVFLRPGGKLPLWNTFQPLPVAQPTPIPLAQFARGFLAVLSARSVPPLNGCPADFARGSWLVCGQFPCPTDVASPV